MQLQMSIRDIYIFSQVRNVMNSIRNILEV